MFPRGSFFGKKIELLVLSCIIGSVWACVEQEMAQVVSVCEG